MAEILMTIDSLIKGGTERRMLELIKSLIKHKPDVNITLISLSECVEYEYVHDLPIRFYVLERKSKRDWSFFIRLYKIIKEVNPQIIHSWGSMASVFVAPLALLTRTRFINGFIGRAPLGLTFRDTHYLRSKVTNLFSDFVVSNSKAGLRAYRVSSKKGVCIYNGVDMSRFEKLQEKSLVFNSVFGDEDHDDLFVIAMVAAFEPRKDHKTFVESALQISQRHSNARFLLIGSGQNYESIRQLIPKALFNKLIFLGKRSDVESLLQVVDVGVLLTNTLIHGEGVANSIIEYMASKIPVIATKGGGTDEVISDGVNGFLIDFQGVSELVDKVEILINNRKIAKEMGKNGAQFVAENFESIVSMRQYVMLYNSLLKEKFKIL